jgi:hypothetical protein
MTNPVKPKRETKLTKSQKVTITAAIIGGVFGVVATCIVISFQIINLTLGPKIEQQFNATPPFSPPTNAVQLPAHKSEILSVAIFPGISCSISAGLVTEKIDRSLPSQIIPQQNVIFPSLSWRYARLNCPSTVEIILTGKSSAEPVQISNEVPIKLISYQPVPDDIDMVDMPIGGGEDIWLLGVDISDKVLDYPEQIVWAKYTPDLQSRLLAEINDDPVGIKRDIINEFPSEIQKVILSDTEPLPDYFLLENNERIVLSVASFYKTPGIYKLQYGVEYFYDTYKVIAWAEPFIEIYVPNNYHIWSCGFTTGDNNSPCHLIKDCLFQITNDYKCTDR